MPTYRDLAMLARIYARQAHVVTTRKIAAELWRRASQYQAEAGKLDNGRLPDIGEPPPCLRPKLRSR